MKEWDWLIWAYSNSFLVDCFFSLFLGLSWVGATSGVSWFGGKSAFFFLPHLGFGACSSIVFSYSFSYYFFVLHFCLGFTGAGLSSSNGVGGFYYDLDSSLESSITMTSRSIPFILDGSSILAYLAGVSLDATVSGVTVSKFSSLDWVNLWGDGVHCGLKKLPSPTCFFIFDY